MHLGWAGWTGHSGRSYFGHVRHDNVDDGMDMVYYT